jgi:hypothetical protein
MSMLTLLWMVTLSPSQLPPLCLSTLFVLHILLLHSFVLLRFFNEHQIYYCSFWSFLITCTSTSSMSTQKFNYICSNFIYIVNYRLCKLHFPIVRFAFFTFWKWWWLQQWSYSQQLNIQHSIMFCFFQLFFCFFFSTILLPRLASICAHFSMFPFPLLFSMIF